jgi:hypothetical protein
LNSIAVAALAVVAFAYQGGMMLYYLRRRRPVLEALTPVDR